MTTTGDCWVPGDSTGTATTSSRSFGPPTRAGGQLMGPGPERVPGLARKHLRLRAVRPGVAGQHRVVAQVEREREPATASVGARSHLDSQVSTFDGQCPAGGRLARGVGSLVFLLGAPNIGSIKKHEVFYKTNGRWFVDQ